MWPTTTTLVPTPIPSPSPSPPITPFNSIVIFTPPSQRFPTTINAALPRRSRAGHHQVSATAEDVGGLGQAILSAANRSGPQTTNSPVSTSQQGKHKFKVKQKDQEKSKKEEKGKEISGSDILWAMQKASARKTQISTNKKNKHQQQQQKRNLGANANRVVDNSKVRPLSIKNDWATRLEDLQKRLQEFSTF